MSVRCSCRECRSFRFTFATSRWTISLIVGMIVVFLIVVLLTNGSVIILRNFDCVLFSVFQLVSEMLTVHATAS